MKEIPSYKRLRLSSWIILTTGLIAAILVYIFTPPGVSDSLNDPSLSKRYVHDLEVYGGRANVLQDELVRWFDGLWQGRELASTIAYITGFTFLVMRFIVNPFRLNTPTTPGSQGSTQAESASDPVTGSNPSHRKNHDTGIPGKRKSDSI